LLAVAFSAGGDGGGTSPEHLTHTSPCGQPVDRVLGIRVSAGRPETRSDGATGPMKFAAVGIARDHCDGRETVKDIGDFAAHHNERDRGIITRSTREWFTTVRFHMPSYQPNGTRQYDGQKMPAATRDYLKIARIDPRIITDKTKLRRADAFTMALALAERLNQNADGTWALPTDMSKAEMSLLECLASVTVVKPAFDDDRLVEDFLATLRSNGLITKEEIAAHKDDLSAVVKLYAVAAMHNCVVQISDGNTTQLKGMIHRGAEDKIFVNCSIPGEMPNMPNVNFAFDIFTAKLAAADYCEPELLTDSPWDFEVEVAPNKKLTPLR
jgi:hypothetical protein